MPNENDIVAFVGLLDDLKHRRLNASRKRLPRLITLNGLKRHFLNSP